MSELSENKSSNQFNQHFWKPSRDIVSFVFHSVEGQKINKVLEMTNTPNFQVFPLTSKRLLWFDCSPDMITPEYDYMFIRHTLEFVQKPQEFLEQIQKNIKKGYIELISPFVEITKGVYQNAVFKGHLYSRHLIWVSEDHVLHILPKSVLIEAIQFDDKFEQDVYNMLSKVPYYWNSYYMWDEEHPLKWVYYQHGVNLDFNTTYVPKLQQALEESSRSINAFLMYINDKNSSIKQDTPHDSLPPSS